VDQFLERHRIPVVVITILLVVIASPLLILLPFDFNPLHLRNPKVESVATFLELRKDPRTGPNAVEIMTLDLITATKTAQRLSSLPQVSETMTLDNLVPGDQDVKLDLIRRAASALGPALDPALVKPPPTDEENAKALAATAADLSAVAGKS
jgi:hypothetical protein